MLNIKIAGKDEARENKAKEQLERILKQHIDAGGILVNKHGEVYLIYSQKNNIWLFPKGHIEEGETLEEAAIREVIEETGYLDFELVNNPIISTYNYNEDGKINQKRVTFYPLVLKSTKRISYDHKGKWVKTDEVENYLSHKELKTVYKKFISLQII